MKVWVVEWRSAVLGSGADWTDLKGAFSTEEAAKSYAREIAPNTGTMPDILLNPSARVYEFTLDQPKLERH